MAASTEQTVPSVNSFTRFPLANPAACVTGASGLVDAVHVSYALVALTAVGGAANRG